MEQLSIYHPEKQIHGISLQTRIVIPVRTSQDLEKLIAVRHELTRHIPPTLHVAGGAVEVAEMMVHGISPIPHIGIFIGLLGTAIELAHEHHNNKLHREKTA